MFIISKEPSKFAHRILEKVVEDNVCVEDIDKLFKNESFINMFVAEEKELVAKEMLENFKIQKERISDELEELHTKAYPDGDAEVSDSNIITDGINNALEELKKENFNKDALEKYVQIRMKGDNSKLDPSIVWARSIYKDKLKLWEKINKSFEKEIKGSYGLDLGIAKYDMYSFYTNQSRKDIEEGFSELKNEIKKIQNNAFDGMSLSGTSKSLGYATFNPHILPKK